MNSIFYNTVTHAGDFFFQGKKTKVSHEINTIIWMFFVLNKIYLFKNKGFVYLTENFERFIMSI